MDEFRTGSRQKVTVFSVLQTERSFTVSIPDSIHKAVDSIFPLCILICHSLCRELWITRTYSHVTIKCNQRNGLHRKRMESDQSFFFWPSQSTQRTQLERLSRLCSSKLNRPRFRSIYLSKDFFQTKSFFIFKTFSFIWIHFFMNVFYLTLPHGDQMLRVVTLGWRRVIDSEMLTGNVPILLLQIFLLSPIQAA